MFLKYLFAIQFWQDERVKWNVTEWGCDSALVAAEQLWLPDVTLLNAAASGDAGACCPSLLLKLEREKLWWSNGDACET